VEKSKEDDELLKSKGVENCLTKKNKGPYGEPPGRRMGTGLGEESRLYSTIFVRGGAERKGGGEKTEKGNRARGGEGGSQGIDPVQLSWGGKTIAARQKRGEYQRMEGKTESGGQSPSPAKVSLGFR